MRTLLILAIVCALVQPAPAVMPETMSYQGALRDVSGSPVPDGVYSVTFGLWDSNTGGTEHWSETLDVSTEGGLFSVVLGKTSSLSAISFEQAFWLGIEIAGEPELAPRIELTASPYSLRARYADLEFPYYATAAGAAAFTVENTSGTAVVGRGSDDGGHAGVRGENGMGGSQWGALGYFDGSEYWGMYTPQGAYVGGILQLPLGAVNGYVLKSLGDGYAYWDAPSEFALPYSGSMTDPLEAGLIIENTLGSAIVGKGVADVGHAAVLGEDHTGTVWGALSYGDAELESWGVYTPDDAYVGGTLRLPLGAVDGHVLTSSADGHAYWDPPSYLTLPFSGTTSTAYPAFYIENAGPAIIGRGGDPAGGNWAGVRGEYYDGSKWGALGHIDGNSNTWGVYTPSNAYFGGEAYLDGGVQMPAGAADGYVLTTDGSGNGTWQAPPTEFTLPYSGAVWSTGPVFEVENTNTSAVARFIGLTAGDQVEIGTDHWTGNALRLSGSATHAKIGGGTTTDRNDIVIDATTGDVGIGLTPSAKLHVDGRVRAEDVMLTTGPADGLPLVSDATGVGSWSQLGPAGLADPMNFGSQTWDWDFTNGHLDIDGTAASPILDITNSSSDAGGVALLRSTSTSASPGGTIVLWVTTQKGRAGTFKKYTADGYSTVDILADSPTGLGLYVSGTITSTSYSARGVETSRGTEPLFAAETAEPEIYDSGAAFLSGGRATVSFDRVFTEAVSRDARVRVTVTPIGGWSALYVDSTGPDSFSVRSADGDPNIEFFWTACGLSKDHEVGSRITFPEPE